MRVSVGYMCGSPLAETHARLQSGSTVTAVLGTVTLLVFSGIVDTARADHHEKASEPDGYILECPDKHRSDGTYRVIEGERIRVTLYTNRSITSLRRMTARFSALVGTAPSSYHDTFSDKEVRGGYGKERAGVDIQTYDDDHYGPVRSFRVTAFERTVSGGSVLSRPTLSCTIGIIDNDRYPIKRLDTTSSDVGHTSSTRKWLGTYNDELFAFLGVLNRSDDQHDWYGFSLTRRTELVLEFHKQHASSHPGALQVWSDNGGSQGSVGPGETRTFTLEPGTHELRVSMDDGTATQRNYEHYDVIAKAWIDDGSAEKATDLGTLADETRTITGWANRGDDFFDYYKLTLDKPTRVLLRHVEGAPIELRNAVEERVGGPLPVAGYPDLGIAARDSETIDLEPGTYYLVVAADRGLWHRYKSAITVSVRKPVITDVSVTSQPRVGDTYGRGETVEVQVTFDRDVVVSGLPVVALIVGIFTRGALYASGSGTRVLTFHYEIGGENHTDTDGITIRGSGLVGRSIITDEFGSTANRAYSQQWNLSGHKVDGTVERAPSKPTGLTAGPATLTTVALSWTAPEYVGATAVTGYKVEWSADGNDPWMVAEADTGSTSTAYTHTGRTPQTTYHYRVSAINSVGAGAASESVSATTLALPVVTISASLDTGGNPVTAVTEGNDARFTLTFTGNVTELSHVEVGLEVQGDFFAGSETTFQKSKLSPGKLEVHVVTTTTADALDEADGSVTATLFPGDGYTIGRPKTATVTILDDDEVPGAIGNLAASAGNEQVILSWSPPMDAGTSPVLGFDYRVRDDAGMNWSNWTDTGVGPGMNNPAHTVTNVDNGTPYTFEVRARSAAGNGPPSNQASATPLPPPVLTSIEFTSDPGSDATYAIDDEIVATVTFDRTLQVDTGNGTPALALTIGNGTGDATCVLATDTKKLECTYTVVGDDEDTDGVSIGANQLTLGGGRIYGIHGATGGDANLTHAALGSDASHKVDGVRPTLQNASVNGIELTLEWSETLDTGSAPAAGQFVLSVDNGTAPTVSSLTMSGTIMTLTLASAADATKDYTLAYSVPSSNPVKDLAGNEAAMFAGTEIETVQITWSFTLTSSRTDSAGNPLVVEGGATATATVSIINAVTTTVAQKVKLQWDGTDVGGDSEPGRLLTTAGVEPTITVLAGESSASAVISVREDALYAPTQTAALTATHLGTQIGSADLTLADDDEPPVMTIAVSASAAASDTRMDAITINEGEGFHLEITLDRGFATFQPPLGSAVTVTAPPGTFNAGDLAAMPPSFARDIRTFGTIINSTDNTTAAGAVDAVFTIAPGVDGRYRVGTPASATVRILDNDAVPTMPRNLTAKEDDREVALRWDLPESYNDIELTGYQYRVRERGGAWSPDWTRIPDSEATTTSHTVTGLTNGTKYTFEVRGINSKGGGPAASVDGRPLDVGIRFANHSVEEGGSTTLRILPPGAPFDAGVEKILTIVLASRGGADRPRVATDYILRSGTTPISHSDRAFDVPGLAGAQPHFTVAMPALLEELALTLETVEDEVAECHEELFAYAWIHDLTDPANRTRIVADARRSDNLFIEDDDPHAKLESAQIDGATVTLTFDRTIDETEAAEAGDPDYDPGYLPIPPRSHFAIWSRGSTAPAWGNSSGVPPSVAWRSNGPGPDAGTDASSFVLSRRTVALTFPEPIAQGENAWLAYHRTGIRGPLGKATEGRCRRAVPKFITVLTNVTGTTGGATPRTIRIADAEGFEGAETSVDFSVTLDRASSDTVTVDYITSAGTATAAQDYTTTSGTVTFAPGDTAETISVPIIDDQIEDGGETFTVTLSNPTNGTLGNRTATGTIHNNDHEGIEGPGDALTARFVNMPSEHDGPGEPFTFELAFSEEVGVSYVTLRDESFTVTAGDVTSARRVDGRHDLWEITVEPDSGDSVAITLPGNRACDTTGAVCTRGDDPRPLSNSPSATVAGASATPLTASFGDMPATHMGEEFEFRLTFSEAPEVSYVTLRDEAFDVTGGTVRKAKRRTQGSNLAWDITVKPNGVAAVTIELPVTTDCTAPGAICTGDNRPLSNALSATVAGASTASALVDGPTLTLAWPTPPDGFALPGGSDFAVRVDGGLRAVASASFWTSGVALHLSEPVQPGQNVVLDYLGSAMHPLRDAMGAPRPPWRDLAATNVTGLAVPRGVAGSAEAADGTLSASLAGRAIDDAGLWALAGRTELRRLDLSGNALVDILALSGLRALESLDLSGNAVSDLAPLAGLTELRRLDLAGNRIDELWPLEGLPKLEVLLLDGNRVADIGALTHLGRLENLGLAGNFVEDVTPLADLWSLRRLDLGGNPARDLSPVGDLETLVWLRLPCADERAPTHRLVRLRWLLAPNASVCLGCGDAAPGHAEAR